MITIGDMLLNLIRDARSEVTLVAPFVKATTLSRLVDYVRPDVSLICVTRWHPHEIKAGVSDIEVWDTMQDCEGSRLMLVPNLHAKYYRADGSYLVGSANLTMAALGWSMRPNVELVVSGEVDGLLKGWETSLVSEAAEVDDILVQDIRGLVDSLSEEEAMIAQVDQAKGSCVESTSTSSDSVFSPWIPRTRYPEQLYDAYAGHTSELSIGALETMRYDLWALAIPQGLGEEGFRVAMAAVLLQVPVIRELDRFVAVPRTFGSVREFLGSWHHYPTGRDPATDWQTIMRWLRYFLPQRFHVSVPNHSEVIFKTQ